MRIKGIMPVIVSSLLGLVLVLAPMAVMLIWSDNEGIKGAQTSLIIMMIVGVAVELFAIAYTAKYVAHNRAMVKGKQITAKFLSCKCKSTSSTKDYYSIKYSYTADNGRVYVKESPIDYSREQSLALKFAEQFEVTVYGKSSYITQDIQPLIVRYKDKIDEFKKQYATAYNEYHNDNK